MNIPGVKVEAVLELIQYADTALKSLLRCSFMTCELRASQAFFLV